MIFDNSTPKLTYDWDLKSVRLDERPPPYTGRGNSVLDEVPIVNRGAVNQIVVRTRHEDINGTYFIDPDLSVPDSGTLRRGRKCSKRSTPRNASFRTRRGIIDINLVVTGSPNNESKAAVELISHKSDIAINLLCLQEKKHISLEATSKSGNVIVLLPKSFCGAIQLRSPKGRMKYLPAFSNHMRVVNSTNEEALLFVGETGPAQSGSAISSVSDYCKLTSRRGQIVIGLSGEDIYEPEQGFWKRLGVMLSGGNEKRRNELAPTHND